MIERLVQPAVEWLVQSGPPNWVFIVALLTTARDWSRKVSAMWDKYTPDKQSSSEA